MLLACLLGVVFLVVYGFGCISPQDAAPTDLYFVGAPSRGEDFSLLKAAPTLRKLCIRSKRLGRGTYLVARCALTPIRLSAGIKRD